MHLLILYFKIVISSQSRATRKTGKREIVLGFWLPVISPLRNASFYLGSGDYLGYSQAAYRIPTGASLGGPLWYHWLDPRLSNTLVPFKWDRNISLGVCSVCHFLPQPSLITPEILIGLWPRPSAKSLVIS